METDKHRMNRKNSHFSQNSLDKPQQPTSLGRKVRRTGGKMTTQKKQKRGLKALMTGFTAPATAAAALALFTPSNAGAQNSIQADPYFCPTGFSFQPDDHLCGNEEDALGPFSEAMIKACESSGGGKEACNGNTWAYRLAANLQGNKTCPRGTHYDKGIAECVDANNAYGPFRKSLVQKCKQKGGGEAACESMRWSRSFTTNLKNVNSGRAANSVPYFYQYDNWNEPGSTCGVTSAAMVLSAAGTAVNPDQLYNRYGKPQGQSPEGLAQIYRWEGYHAKWSRTATRAELKAHLRAGRPVVVHGHFTGAGHIVVLTGYNQQGWIVNDPAGNWYGCHSCGHSYELGHGVLYTYGEMNGAVLGYDGDIWMSVLSTSPF